MRGVTGPDMVRDRAGAVDLAGVGLSLLDDGGGGGVIVVFVVIGFWFLHELY